jgi:ribosomal protein S18 acetylase RimI-like enzyme
MSELNFRDTPVPTDRSVVRQLAHDSGGFTAREIEVAVELVEERLTRGLSASGYHFLFAQWAPGVPALGYACYGPIPLTSASWDLYWIAVARPGQGRGIGRRLLAEVERRAAALGAASLYADSSGRNAYARTRAFYLAAGYSRAADLPDFYGPGDAKVVFAKRL